MKVSSHPARIIGPLCLVACACLLACLLAPAAAAPVAPRSGVIVSPVVSVHRYPSFTSETVTQALMGEPARVAAIRGPWVKITLSLQYDYPGWVPASALRVGAEPPRGDRVQVTRAVASVRSMAGTNRLCPVYLSTVLALLDADAKVPPGQVAVLLPDGRSGLLSQADVRRIHSHEALPQANAAGIVASARQFRGTRYLWGGMSARGIDCSGFVHAVYRLHGIQLHRDADQQFEQDGVPVARNDLQPGDLLYFRTSGTSEISHVGLYVGRGQVLHASSSAGGVNYSSLSNSYLNRCFAGARRILP